MRLLPPAQRGVLGLTHRSRRLRPPPPPPRHLPQEITRFLRNPLKPAILAMSRPDTKKNITMLVQAFGEHATLRELANLVLVMVSAPAALRCAGAPRGGQLHAGR